MNRAKWRKAVFVSMETFLKRRELLKSVKRYIYNWRGII